MCFPQKRSTNDWNQSKQIYNKLHAIDFSPVESSLDSHITLNKKALLNFFNLLADYITILLIYRNLIAYYSLKNIYKELPSSHRSSKSQLHAQKQLTLLLDSPLRELYHSSLYWNGFCLKDSSPSKATPYLLRSLSVAF